MVVADGYDSLSLCCTFFIYFCAFVSLGLYVFQTLGFFNWVGLELTMQTKVYR